MAKIYNHIKKQLEKCPEVDLNTDTIKIELSPTGVVRAGEQTWFERLWNQYQDNLARKIMPIYKPWPEVKMTHAIIYQDTGREEKYFDIETPVRLHGGFKPRVMVIDLTHESSK